MHSVHDSIAGQAMRALLHRIPLFAGLPDEQLDHLARMAVRRQVPRHKTIVFVGAETDCLFVIVSGSAKVLNRDAEGREVILSMLEAGECFGEMGLIDGSPRSADVVANEPCDLLIISKMLSSLSLMKGRVSIIRATWGYLPFTGQTGLS